MQKPEKNTTIKVMFLVYAYLDRKLL